MRHMSKPKLKLGLGLAFGLFLAILAVYWYQYEKSQDPVHLYFHNAEYKSRVDKAVSEIYSKAGYERFPEAE